MKFQKLLITLLTYQPITLLISLIVNNYQLNNTIQVELSIGKNNEKQPQKQDLLTLLTGYNKSSKVLY